MIENTDMLRADYDPAGFLDWLRDDVLMVRNDSALARKLGQAPALISKIRHKKLPVGAAILIAMHEETGLPTKTLRARLFLVKQ